MRESNTDHITKEKLISQMEQGSSLRDMADIFGVNHNTIAQKIKKFGITKSEKTKEILTRDVFDLSDALIERHYQDVPVDVEFICKEEGFRVIYSADFEGALSGMFVPPGTIYINKNHSKNRQRFTLGHELGHAILARHRNKENPAKKHESVGFRVDYTYSEEDKRSERDANLFSANLLMPAKYLLRDVKREKKIVTESVIEDLAERYHVSQVAMLRRLNTLGYR